jgi:nucleoid DNA-binding protein
MKHLQTRQVIREVAKQNGLSMEEATSILESIPEFVKEIIKTKVDKLEGYYPTIRVQGWGTFYVNQGVKKHIQTLLLKRLEEEKNEFISDSKLAAGD